MGKFFGHQQLVSGDDLPAYASTAVCPVRSDTPTSQDSKTEGEAHLADNFGPGTTGRDVTFHTGNTTTAIGGLGARNMLSHTSMLRRTGVLWQSSGVWHSIGNIIGFFLRFSA